MSPGAPLKPKHFRLEHESPSPKGVDSMLNKVRHAPKIGEHPTWARASYMSPCPL
jgi:hypothetical protein